MAKDPSCGMEVNEKEAEGKGLVSTKEGKKYYFCSLSCKEKFEGKVKWYRSEMFGKVFPWFLGIVLVVGTGLSMIYDFMILYMGIFFILFSLMKMPDWKGFVNAFSNYDLIAKRVKVYGWIYPGLEFALGLMYLFNYFVVGAAWVTLVIMAVGGIGVAKNIFSKTKFKCACLGTMINVPLTKVTLLENVLMVLMALRLLFF